MNPKYQIFISSTFKDLKEEREHVLNAILRMGHIPIGMELFNAANQTQWEMIKRRIEESDYYIVIIARRYGSIEAESGLGYTEKEYDYARSIGVPAYGFVLDSTALWPGDRGEVDPALQEALRRFIEKVEGNMRSAWSNKDNLVSNVTLALNEATTAFPRVGWVRADKSLNPETANEMARLSKENADLRDQIAVLQRVSSTAPMPEIDLKLQFREGQGKWFELPPKNVLPSHGIASFGLDRVTERPRFSLWLQIAVSNNGTLATSFALTMSCAVPIVAHKDLEAFKKKDFLNITSQGDGWRSVIYTDTSNSWTFEGGGNNLKPGQTLLFEIPIDIVLLNSVSLDDAVIEIDLHPMTGNHIHQSHNLRALAQP